MKVQLSISYLITAVAGHLIMGKIEVCTSTGKIGHIEVCKFNKNLGVTIKCNIKKPITKAIIVADVSTQRAGVFIPIFKTVPFDWCLIAKDGRIKNIALIRLAVETYAKYIEPFLDCPVFGKIDVENAMPDNSILNLIPSGVYRLSLVAEVFSENNVKGAVNFSVVAENRGMF